MARAVLQSGEMHDCRHRGSAPYRCRLLHGPRAAKRPRLDSMPRWSRTGAVPETTEPHAGRIPHSMGDYGEIGHPEIISQANPGVLQRDVCSDMISRTAMAEFRSSAIQPQTPIREVTVRQSRIRQTPGETGSRLHRKNQAPKELPCLHGNCANPAGCAATPRTGLWYRNPGLRASECQASEAKHT